MGCRNYTEIVPNFDGNLRAKLDTLRPFRRDTRQ
jgi:hypothetical protein